MFYRFLLLAIVSGLAAGAFGQETRSDAQQSTEEGLASQLQRVESASDLDETSKAKAVDAYKQALSAAEAFSSFEAQAESFQRQLATIEQDIAAAKEALTKGAPEPTIDVVRLTLKDLDSAVQQKTADLESLRQEVASKNDAIAAREKRLLGIPKAVADANKRLAEVEQDLNAATPPDQDQRVTTAQATLLEQSRKAIQQEIEALKQENSWQLASGELLPLQRDLAKRQLDAVQSELELWQSAAREKRETEVDRDVRAANAFAKDASELLMPIAAANQQYAVRRSDVESALKQSTQLQEELQARVAKVDQQYARAVQEAQADLGVSQTLGEVLREKRVELRNYESQLPDERKLRSQVSETRLQLYLLREAEAELDDLDAATAAELEKLSIPTDSAATVREQLEFRRSLLKGLRTDTEALFQVLAKLEGTEVDLRAKSQLYATFIDERVLWIRSTDAFGPAHLGTAIQTGRQFLRPAEWATLPSELMSLLKSRPLIPILTLIASLPLVYFGFRMRRQIREHGQKAESGGCRDFSPTLKASLLTAGVSVLWPAVFYCVGVWLRASSAYGSDLIPAFSVGFITAAAVLLPLELWRQSARPQGLMTSHFGVSSRGVSVIWRNLRWFRFVLVPLAVIDSAIRSTANPIYEQSLGRVAFVLAMLALAVFVYRIAHPTKGAPQGYLGRHVDSVIFKLRYVWLGMLVAVPLVLAALAIVGYQFTATQLAQRLLWSGALLLGLWFLHALALRWVVLSRRRLAIEQSRARFAKLSEAEASPVTAEAQANLEQIDLGSVDLQTRRLVRAITVVAGFLALWSLWVDVLPALSRFDQIKAWEVSVPVATTTTTSAESGSVEMAGTAQSTIKVVSYADIAVAIAIFVAMLLAMRDVPGLLELVLLQRLPLDAALRFAISTLTRYVIFIVGTAWALGTLEIGWSKVQWLVAGISVGLGFGLQEIFANFVSGLIILFERPLRAGDIVTIDGVTGTVKSVQMRATIISDLDRKDFIVPNKDFITGRVLNWTLSDEVSRIVIPVGVAYGSDTEAAKSLILGTAVEHPKIVDDPAALVTFEAFGDNSLNLVLRCFISLQDMPSRLKIIDELYTKIDQRLRNASIEIPFPQRDLHLRSSDIGLPAVQVDANGAGSTAKQKPRQERPT